MAILRAREAATGTSDEAQARLVPCLDELYQAVVDLVVGAAPQAARILDLGAGTGILSQLLAQALPEAELTLVEPDPQRQAEAGIRLSDAGARHRLVEAAVDGPLPDGPFDAVVSALVLHRLPDEERRAVFGKVHDVLGADGLFVAAEQVAGPSLQLDDLYHQTWVRQLRAAGVAEQVVEAALQGMVYDHPSTLPDQLEALVEAGFRDVDCFFKDYRFAVIGGWSAVLPSAG